MYKITLTVEEHKAVQRMRNKTVVELFEEGALYDLPKYMARNGFDRLTIDETILCVVYQNYEVIDYSNMKLEENGNE